MIKETDLFGIYLAPFVTYIVVALIVFFPIRLWFDRIEIQKWFWHRTLLDFAVFMIILSGITLFFLN